MKNYFLTLLFVLISGANVFAQSAPKVEAQNPAAKFEREKFDPSRNSVNDLQTAIAEAQRESKRIILDVGGEWCGWCIHMDKFLVINKELKNLRDANFIWLKINFSEENKNAAFLANYPEIKGFPHLFVLDGSGAFLYSKDTSELENGKSYDLQKFTDFLKKWSPAKSDEK